MEILKNFIVFEGIDGSGTTTQINILEKFFLHAPQPLPTFYKTFEPTDSSIGRIIRSALRKEITLRPETAALLFAADRNEHLYGYDGVAERCANGELVVSDRYVPSSLVYQGLLCGEELPAALNKDFPAPEMLFFFDIDPEIAQKRMAGREIKEIYEFLEFQIQVRRRYDTVIRQFADHGVTVVTLDATRPADEVAKHVWMALQKLPIIKR